MNKDREVLQMLINNYATAMNKGCGYTLKGTDADAIVKALMIPVVRKRNWFEKLPLHWRYTYYLLGGISIGYLLSYVL